MEINELNQRAMGGTELMQLGLERHVDPELLSKFQIIASRARELDPDRKKILWCHDLPRDPEVAHLADGGYQKYDHIVFVSHWQRAMYHEILGVPYSHSSVMLNAIEPNDKIVLRVPGDRKVRLVYFSTPHRGLDLLYPVFAHMAKTDPDLELHVYSSFKLYGWEQRDEPFRPLFDAIDAHPQIINHGTVSNAQIREDLPNYDILAYPSTWQETSCLCLIEAMASGLLCVHSSLGALPETSMQQTLMYNYTDDRTAHANRFLNYLDYAVQLIRSNDERVHHTLKYVTPKLINNTYGWEIRGTEWEVLLNSILTRD